MTALDRILGSAIAGLPSRILLLAWLVLAMPLVPALVLAHPGGLAKDGCHNHRATGTCHCHRTGAVRLGCTSEYDGEQGGNGTSPAAKAAHGASHSPNAAPDTFAVEASPAPADWIRIATWNLNRLHWRTGGALWRGGPARSDDDYRTLARYARVINADIIAYQEANGPRAAERVFPTSDYSLHFSGRYDSRYDGIYRNGPRELDSAVSEIFLGFQAAKSR